MATAAAKNAAATNREVMVSSLSVVSRQSSVVSRQSRAGRVRLTTDACRLVMIFRYSMRRKGRALMRNMFLKAAAVAVALSPAIGIAQSGSKPTAATYITDEDVKTV